MSNKEQEQELVKQNGAGGSTPARVLRIQLSNVLESKGVGKQVHLKFSNVAAWVPLSPTKPGLMQQWRQRKQPKEQTYKQILHNIRGEVHPGEILACMGPSGSGKTSLLCLLGGRAPGIVQHEGIIQFNGNPLTKSIKRNLGFVLQDDLLFPTLTVLETLTYAAYLRLPRNMSKEEKNSRVSDVIIALGLESCTNTIIGGGFQRGVSGGERKRVSVGHELITNPSVIFLDEPTSGLDSTTALKLIETLKDLSQGGRTIITTIHQPSSRLYFQLDKLLLLCQGHVMYYGKADGAAAWFANLNYAVPFGVNIADHILDLANGDVPTSKLSEDDIKKQLIAVCEKYLERRPAAGFVDDEDLKLMRVSMDEARGSETIKFNSVREFCVVSEDDSDSDILDKKQENSGQELGVRWGAGYGTQISVLLQRAYKTRRFEALGSEKLVQIGLVAVVAGLLWWQAGRGDTLLTANDIASLVFFMGIFMSFFTLFSALFTFPPEFRLLLKERSSGMYRLSAYYFAKTAAEIPLNCLYPSIFVFIVYWMAWLRPDAGAFFATWGCILLLVLTAESVGLLLGAAVMNIKSAQTIASVFMLTVMLAGGFLVRDVPVWMNWAKYVSFIYWGYSLCVKIQFRDTQFDDCGDLGLEKECEPVSDLTDALVLPRDVNETMWIEAGVLLGMLLLLRLAVYYFLNNKTRSV
eukprot:TRINITY_DN8514_c1_g1_i1.p1 TRINITY_DN8514_c1_g1~~TRINITY_DN8514_c1_g1_i1.p1  ORF type:complete len:745 (+),score=131.75 TRINITY_DN8514_c1_g1_i1:162-2237(+)